MHRWSAAALATAAIVVGLAAPGAAQDDDDRPTAVVSMGDSYLSGEAGRWEGNSSSDWGDRRGTDRAAYRSGGWIRFWRYDAGRIYGATDRNGCHRSDVAPILSSGIDVDARINLACSGAEAENLWRASSGGSSFKGEAPQADQLAAVAATHDVEMIVVSVGGNDLGFADIILDCTVRYVTSRPGGATPATGPSSVRSSATSPARWTTWPAPSPTSGP